MAEELKHAKTSSGSRRLCDIMLGCLPPHLAPSMNHKTNWCTAHISSREAALYWVRHSRKQIAVFLRCEDSPEVFSLIQANLPAGIVLKQRAYPRKGIAISTPLFFFVQSEEQARGMGPLLKLLSSPEFDPRLKNKRSISQYWVPYSENIDAKLGAAEEGARITGVLNRYERDLKNRTLCLSAHGAWCRVCKFDFGKTYGVIGEGYIHVHHLTPLKALKGKARKPDPVKDMIPVCPNCHEMLHRIDPPYAPDQLRAIIAEAKEKASSPRALNSRA